MIGSLTARQRILLDEILARDEDVKIVPWPRRPGVTVGLRLLTDGEMADADAGAREWADGKGLGVGLDRQRDNEFASRYAAEIMIRALVHPESRQPVVTDVEQLRARVHRQELDLLIRAYNDYARDMFADPDALTVEQLGDLVARIRVPFDLAEGTLNRCAPGVLRRLLHYTVSLLPESTGSES